MEGNNGDTSDAEHFQGQVNVPTSPSAKDGSSEEEANIEKEIEALRSQKKAKLREERERLKKELADVESRLAASRRQRHASVRSRSSPPKSSRSRSKQLSPPRDASLQQLRADSQLQRKVEARVRSLENSRLGRGSGRASTSRESLPSPSRLSRGRSRLSSSSSGGREEKRRSRRKRSPSSSRSPPPRRTRGRPSSSSDTGSDASHSRRQSPRSRGKDYSRSYNKSGLTKIATDRVNHPQTWPHMALHFEFGLNKEKRFFDLDLRTFVAGELEIINNISKSKTEKAGRNKLLQSLLYLAGSYEWSAILNVYAAVLGRIERGLENWGGNFSQLTQMVLTQEGNKRLFGKGPKSKFDQPRGGPPNKEWIYFCSKFQRNACPELSDHQGTFKGKPVRFFHICAKCWQRDQIKKPHPESSPECPFHKS